MKKLLYIAAFAVAFMSCATEAATPKRSNYVVFNIKGDCGGEDCIAVMKDALKDPSFYIVSLDVSSLAPHQTIDYKTVIVTFKSLDNPFPPYQAIMDKITEAGYRVVSYVIHDTHDGKDTIIPH